MKKVLCHKGKEVISYDELLVREIIEITTLLFDNEFTSNKELKLLDEVKDSFKK